MTKSPAFQFYPDDFLGSGKVGTMTLPEIGAYFLLLCLEWNETGFIFDEEELARWCKMSRPAFRKAWRRISRCFVPRDGRMFNPRLDLEREKQRVWREKSAKGGRASAEARRKGGSTTLEPPYPPPAQPNVNTPSPSPSPTPKETTTARAAPWLPLVAAAYEQRKGAGSFPFAKAGRLLKPLHTAGNTGEEIATRLGRYIDWLDDQKYLSLQKFRETFGDYSEGEPAWVRKLGGYPEFVIDGELTEYGERVTRPAGLRIA